MSDRRPNHPPIDIPALLARYAALRKRRWDEIARNKRAMDQIEADHDALRAEVGDPVYWDLEVYWEVGRSIETATHREADR